MNGPSKFVVLSVLCALLTAVSVRAQSVYSNAVASFSPVGYWPMHENEAMTHGDIETNYGSAGPLANGFFGDWVAPVAITHGYTPGIISGDPDPCIYFNYFFSGTGNKGSPTNCLIIPHTSPFATLVPPFTVELWYYNTNNLDSGRQSDIWAEGGGNYNGAFGYNGSSSLNGIRLYLNNSLNVYTYNNGVSTTSPGSTQTILFGQWYHIALTDDGTNIQVYIDGNNVITNWPNSNYRPDSWDPLEVDTGKGFQRDATGLMQDFAVYTNALSQIDITNHYAAGITANAPVPYETLVFNDHPAILYRMDSPSFSQPPAASLPALSNYGSAGINGLYTAGTIPAGVAGPNNGQVFAAGFGAGTNAMPGSGMSTFADAGTSGSYNFTGTTANFSVSAWFQGDPCDSRIQTIIGHGTNSWGITMNTAGLIVFSAGTNNTSPGSGTAAGDLASPSQYNDGFWHFVVATHGAGVNTLYLDGVPVGTNSTTANILGSTADVMIGSDPSFTNNPVSEGRQFEGNICEAAVFGAALTAVQVQTLYNASEMAPYLSTQPVSAMANQGTSFTNTVAARGALPLSYQWFANGAPIGSQTNASLVLNPVESGDALTNYYVVVANDYGSVTSVLASLTVNTSPTFTGQYPVAYTNLFTLYSGANPTFSVSVSGAGPLAYQWFTNGLADGIATNASLTLTNVQVGVPITNFCVVTNFLGAITSIVWNASVVPDPVNNNLAGSPDAPYPTNVLSLHPIGYWRLNDAGQGGNDGLVGLDYAGGNNAIYTNTVLGDPGYNPNTDPSDTSANMGSSAFPTNSCAAFIGTNIDFAASAGGSSDFTVEAWVNLSSDSTVTYPQGSGIVCKGVPNGGEEFALETTASPVFAFLVRAANGTAYTAAAPNGPTIGAWYHLVGVCDESGGHIYLYMDGQLAGSTSIPAGSGIYNGSVVNMTIGSRSTLPAAISEQMDGYLNDVAVFNYALSSNQISSEYFASGVPPFFTQQPSSTYVGLGSNATVVATANGSPLLGYQWYETNLTALTGFAVSGQTNATLVISNISSSDNYYLNVSNQYGATNSTIITVTVYSSPVISGSLPVPYTNAFTLYAGAYPNFSVSALGFGTLSYYWLTNGVAVGGAATTNLTLADVQPGLFTNVCVVSNALGWTSNVWVASVIPDPVGTGPGGLAPYPEAVLALKPIGYWRMNDTNLDGVDYPSGAGNGDFGWICHDYAGGNDGMYTNCQIGFPGYNPTADPSDSSAQFGEADIIQSDFGDSLAFGIAGINFGCTNASADFTVEAWVSGYKQDSDAGIVSLGWGNGGEQFDLDTGSDSTNTAHDFRFLIRDASGASHAVSSSTTTAVSGQGPWYHLAGVVDESNSQTMTLYINGVPVGTSSVAKNVGLLESTYLMNIGSRMGSSTTNYNFQFLGNINDVAVYNYALTSGQVANQYVAGGGAIAPYFDPTPATNVNGVANSTLTIPVTALGTPPISYYWTNVTTAAAIATGTTSTSATLDASLNYANVPASWNGDVLELTVSNAYGTTNVFVTPTIANINLNPTNIVESATNGLLTLSWPADHKGWQLQAQTNSLSVGINTNWVNVSGSTGTNQVVIPINLSNGCVFYRLVYP